MVTEMKSQMSINVEFLAETPIEEAVAEARDKALQLDVAYVCFTFKGVSFSIGRNACVPNVVDEWNADRNTKRGICAP
jgi:hypothetical protein